MNMAGEGLGIRTELRELKDELLQAAEALRDSLRLQKEILEGKPAVGEVAAEELVRLKQKIYPYFTYPRDGTKKIVGRGITILDFWDGEVTLPDGTTDYISDKLQAYKGERFIRSFQVDTNKDIVIWVDEFGKKPVDADDIHMETYQNFTRLYIKTTESTTLTVWASTMAEAYVRRLKPGIFRGVQNEYYQIINPIAEYGNPITKLDYYTGSDTTYQTLVSWTVSAGYYGVLQEIAVTATANARYRVTISGVEQFADKKIVSSVGLPVPANKITAGATVLVEVKSASGSIEVNGTITGKEVLAS
jgi:hypothetical protein